MLSVDVRVALAPEATYRQLVAQDTRSAWWRAFARPALALLVIAVVLPIIAVEQITARLVLTVAASWSVVLAIQIVMAALLIASAPARRVSVARAFDLWFAGHLPYNVWVLLLPTVAILIEHALDAITVTALIPIIWSAFIVTAFCRAVLGATPAEARWRAALHQALIVAVMVTLSLWAAGGVEAVISYLLRALRVS